MPPSSPPPTRMPRRFLFLALAVFLGLAALLMTPTLGDMGGDSAQYMSLAESLAEGGGYRDAHLPGRPVHAHFPPGLSLLLLPIVGMFGAQAWLAVKILLLLVAVAGLAVAFLYLEKRFGSWVALGSLALTMSSGSFLTTVVRIQSEMPYLLMGFLSLLLLENKRPRVALLASWLAVSFRLMGLASLLAWAMHGSVSSLRKSGAADSETDPALGWRQAWPGRAARLGLALLPLLIFWAYGSLWARGTWGYGQELLHATGGISGLPLHLAEGLGIQLLHLGRSLGDGVWVSRWPWLQGVLAALILLGLARRLRGGLQAGESFFLLSLGLAVLAPRPLERYLIPLLPLAAAYALEALSALPELWLRLRPTTPRPMVRGWRHPGTIVLLLLLVGHAGALTLLYKARRTSTVVGPPPLLAQEILPVSMNHWEEGWIFGSSRRVKQIQRAYADFLMMLELCRTTLPEDAVLIAAKPRLVSYLTGRPCLGLPAQEVSGAPALIQLGATHLIVDGLFSSTRTALPGGGDRLGLEPIATVRSSACFLLAGAPE